MTKDMIFVHALAVRPDWMAGATIDEKIAEVRRWHVEDRGWADLGYALVIDRDGTVGGGRDLNNDGDYFDDIGAHVKGLNARAVGIALVGGFGGDANDPISKHYTVAQERALRECIRDIESYFGKPMWVRGHNEVAAKACPCFNVAQWYENRPARAVTESTTLRASAASIAAAGTTVLTTVGELEGASQLAVIGGCSVVALAGVWVMRERLAAWAGGQR